MTIFQVSKKQEERTKGVKGAFCKAEFTVMDLDHKLDKKGSACVTDSVEIANGLGNQIMPRRCWNGNTRVDELEKEKVLFTCKMLEAEVSELVQVIIMLNQRL